MKRPPLSMRSVVDRNVVMRRIPVLMYWRTAIHTADTHSVVLIFQNISLHTPIVGYSGVWLWPVTGETDISDKNTLARNAVWCYEGELIILCETEFFVAFCVVRALHEFDSRLLTNRTPNKWRLAENDKRLIFW